VPDEAMEIPAMLKHLVKTIANGVALVIMLPAAAMSAFGRIPGLFNFWAQAVALVPGLAGDYLRVAYYFMTLRACSLSMRISFGSFFAHSSARVERSVYIGPYCVLGGCIIGERTQIASHVQIMGGGQQHERDKQGRILGAKQELFPMVSVGADCWLGAASIIMANVGSGTTVGAGAVVPRPLPPNVTAVGNPARVIKSDDSQVRVAVENRG
jgi:acetyltransferase-like isoleucine patch superfamily enzyme